MLREGWTEHVINCRIIGLNIQIRSLIFTVGLDGPICASTLSPSRLKNFWNFTCKCRYGMVHCYTNIFGNLNSFSPIFIICLFQKLLQFGQALFCVLFRLNPKPQGALSQTPKPKTASHPLAAPLLPIAENSDNYDRICCFLCCMFLLR